MDVSYASQLAKKQDLTTTECTFLNFVEAPLGHNGRIPVLGGSRCDIWAHSYVLVVFVQAGPKKIGSTDGSTDV